MAKRWLVQIPGRDKNTRSDLMTGRLLDSHPLNINLPLIRTRGSSSLNQNIYNVLVVPYIKEVIEAFLVLEGTFCSKSV